MFLARSPALRQGSRQKLVISLGKYEKKDYSTFSSFFQLVSLTLISSGLLSFCVWFGSKSPNLTKLTRINAYAKQQVDTSLIRPRPPTIFGTVPSQKKRIRKSMVPKSCYELYRCFLLPIKIAFSEMHFVPKIFLSCFPKKDIKMHDAEFTKYI